GLGPDRRGVHHDRPERRGGARLADDLAGPGGRCVRDPAAVRGAVPARRGAGARAGCGGGGRLREGRRLAAAGQRGVAPAAARRWQAVWLAPAAGAVAVLLRLAARLRPAEAPEPAPAAAAAGD